MTLSGTVTQAALRTDFDALTTRINATMVDGQVDHPVLMRRPTLAVADDVSLRSIAWTPQDDAEVRVLLARRFHNDAVRDTLALRERRWVRLLRLGGRAPLPSYFEIAEPAQR